MDLAYKCIFICWKLKTAFYPKEDLEVVEERKAERERGCLPWARVTGMGSLGKSWAWIVRTTLRCEQRLGFRKST